MTATQGPRRRTLPTVGRDGATAAGFAVVALASRLVFSARQPTEWDSVHYIRALDHFNVVQYWPHAPGYWLYIFVGRVIRFTTGLDGNSSLLLATAIASAATVAAMYFVGVKVADRRLGLTLAAVLLTEPFAWHYGAIVTTKSYDSLLFVTLLLLAYHARPDSRVDLIACVVLGLGGGLRQSAFVLFAPLLIYILARTTRSVPRLLGCLAAGAVSVLMWFLPMIHEQPGGLATIQAHSDHLFNGAMASTSLLVHSSGAKANALEFVGVTIATIIPLVPLLILGLVCGRRDSQPDERRSPTWIPLMLAMSPGLLEALVVHFGTPGYSLSYLPGLLLLFILPMRRLPSTGPIAMTALIMVAVACAYQAERYVFAPTVMPARVAQASRVWADGAYGAPYKETFHALRDLDADQLRYRAIRQDFDPTRDVLVYVTGDGNYRYRIAGYQLPEFTLHLVLNGTDIDQARRGRHTTHLGPEISVPPGGRAVLVIDALRPELIQLMDEGQLESVPLSTGPVVYALKPGNTAFGIRFVSGPLPPI